MLARGEEKCICYLKNYHLVYGQKKFERKAFNSNVNDNHNQCCSLQVKASLSVEGRRKKTKECQAKTNLTKGMALNNNNNNNNIKICNTVIYIFDGVGLKW